jgi:hypothetical protein
MSSFADLLTRETPAVAIRAVHLDLKGVPPMPGRLVSLLDVIAASGYNAVCVEWEDTFPWETDKRIRCETAYTPEEVAAFHARATELGLEIIPLVQCLGHMQFVLKFDDYKPLREVEDGIDVINPLAPGATQLVQDLVDEVVAVTPNLRHFHLGGDEAWTFGTHPDTKAFVEEHGKGALYLKHIDPILDSLNERGIRPMLWHDMMRHWDDEALQRLSKKADLVLWGYLGHPLTEMDQHINPAMIERFQANGIPLWGASAYKGADGHSADLPTYQTRQENAKGWSDTAKTVDIKGVIATAWSRYTHCMCQCEPIDSSLDSLAAHGVTLHEDAIPPREVILKALAGVGEGERFEKCHAAMAAVAKQRKDAWFNIQMGREEVITVSQDKRRADVIAIRTLKTLHSLVRNNFRLYEQMMDAFSGLIAPIWIDRYLRERLDPIVTETMQIEQLVKEAYLWQQQ